MRRDLTCLRRGRVVGDQRGAKGVLAQFSVAFVGLRFLEIRLRRSLGTPL